MDAICIMCRKPHNGNLKVAQDIAMQTNLEVIIITDEPYEPSSVLPKVQVVHIEDHIPMQYGYRKSCFHVSFSKEVVAWDKALYYFGVVNKSHRFVWLLEEDVFVPSVHTIEHLTQKYNENDLVCATHFPETNRFNVWYHWPHVASYIQGPWFCSKVCAVGLSRAMFEEVRTFLEGKERMPFIEGFFNTLAAQKHLKIVVAPELSTIKCACLDVSQCSAHCNTGDIFNTDSGKDYILANTEKLIHPVKSESSYVELYNKINNIQT